MYYTTCTVSKGNLWSMIPLRIIWSRSDMQSMNSTQNSFVSVTWSLICVWGCYVFWFCRLLPVMAGVMKQQKAATGSLIRQQQAMVGGMVRQHAPGDRLRAATPFWYQEGRQPPSSIKACFSDIIAACWHMSCPPLQHLLAMEAYATCIPCTDMNLVEIVCKFLCCCHANM